MAGRWTEAIRERFAFDTPGAFQTLESRGMFDLPEEWRGVDAMKDMNGPGSHYLWMHGMWWLTVEELSSFRFWGDACPGLVPFACSGGGDLWCWRPEMACESGVPVLQCFFDCDEADLYASNSEGAIWRTSLEGATWRESDEDQADRRRMFQRYVADLSGIWSEAWMQEIRRLAEASQTQPAMLAMDRYEQIITRAFGAEYTQATVKWRDRSRPAT